MIPWCLLLLAQLPAESPPPGEPELLPDLAQPALTEPLPTEAAVKPTVTLQELLEAADRQNVDMRISVEQQNRADAEYRQAWTSLLPALSVQAAWTHNQYTAEIPAGPLSPVPITLTPQDQLDLTARVDLPLIDTGKWMRTAAAGVAQEGAKARQRLSADQVRRAVSTGWYGYARALALKESAERSVAVAEAQLKLQDIRFRNGAIPELDIFRSRAELERNRQLVADAVRLIAISRRNLETLTGIDPGEAARLPKVDLRPSAPLSELEANLSELPAVQAAERDLESAEKLVTSSKLALVPVIGAQFTERVSNATSFNGQNTAYNLGVILSWRLDVPTFMGMNVQSANAAIAALALEKTRLLARDQINTDYQSLTAAISKVGAVAAQVEAAQKARDFANTRYQVGASTQIEVIQADRDLFDAEVQQIQAQSDLASARVALQISAGLPIEAP